MISVASHSLGGVGDISSFLASQTNVAKSVVVKSGIQDHPVSYQDLTNAMFSVGELRRLFWMARPYGDPDGDPYGDPYGDWGKSDGKGALVDNYM